MSHIFAARRGGHGVCAFCPDTEDAGDHRGLTDDERARVKTMIDILTGCTIDDICGTVVPTQDDERT